MDTIGQQGIELILKESNRINGDDPDDDNINVDTTVQEKKSKLFPAKKIKGSS